MIGRLRPLMSLGLVMMTLLSAGPALADENVTYIYDARGRLIRVVRTGAINNQVQTDYSYDRADNRTNVTVDGASAGGGGSGNGGAGASAGRFFIVVPLLGGKLIPISSGR